MNKISRRWESLELVLSFSLSIFWHSFFIFNKSLFILITFSSNILYHRKIGSFIWLVFLNDIKQIFEIYWIYFLKYLFIQKKLFDPVKKIRNSIKLFFWYFFMLSKSESTNFTSFLYCVKLCSIHLVLSLSFRIF